MIWYGIEAPMQDVFVSSRVRLARNLSDYPFEPYLVPAAAEEIIEKVRDALTGEGYTEASLENNRAVLFEDHAISREFAKKKTPCALLENREESVNLMVCEEDHVRIQSIMPGLQLKEAYEAALSAECKLDEKLSFAFDEKLGYLTHCPTNLGTGMRASLMMFLPALSMTGKIKNLEYNLSKLGITIRGSEGEGSSAKGSLYQISNSVTMGATEEEIIANLSEAAESVAVAEREMRKRLAAENEDSLRDRIMRAYGTAKYAYMISTEELFRLYSDVRLGAVLGYVDLPCHVIDKAIFENTPAKTEKRAGRELSPTERDRHRAAALHTSL